MGDEPVRGLALWSPDWPVTAAAKAAHVPAHQPAAVFVANRVLACSAVARAQGVRRGLRRREAQARCPDLAVLTPDPDRDARAFEPVVAAVEELAPGVEVVRPGLVAPSQIPDFVPPTSTIVSPPAGPPMAIVASGDPVIISGTASDDRSLASIEVSVNDGATEDLPVPRITGGNAMTGTEERNRALVLEAFDTLFNKRDYVAAQRFWSPDYVQHSAHIEPGRDGLFNLVKVSPPDMRYENGLIVANGDYVMLHGRFSNVGQPADWIVVDVVRLEHGLLAEHWDVIQDEATAEQSKSGLPMFGDTFPSTA